MERMMLLSDPQTSGGLLIAVAPDAIEEVKEIVRSNGGSCATVGRLVPGADTTTITVI